MDRSLTHRRNRSRMVNVHAQVASGIDSGDDPRNFGFEVMERKPDTIGGSSLNDIDAVASATSNNRRVSGDAMAAPRVRPRRCHDVETAHILDGSK